MYRMYSEPGLSSSPSPARRVADDSLAVDERAAEEALVQPHCQVFSDRPEGAQTANAPPPFRSSIASPSEGYPGMAKLPTEQVMARNTGDAGVGEAGDVGAGEQVLVGEVVEPAVADVVEDHDPVVDGLQDRLPARRGAGRVR